MKTVDCPCGRQIIVQGKDPMGVLLRAVCLDCSRSLWDSYFSNLTGTPRQEVYALAHHLIEMAEIGVPLAEIANALQKHKQLMEGFNHRDVAILMVMIPARISQQAVHDRFPLEMADRSGRRVTAHSWKEEQDLRKGGFEPFAGDVETA